MNTNKLFWVSQGNSLNSICSVPPQLCPAGKDARYCLISVHRWWLEMPTAVWSPNITFFNLYELKCEVVTGLPSVDKELREKYKETEGLYQICAYWMSDD